MSITVKALRDSIKLLDVIIEGRVIRLNRSTGICKLLSLHENDELQRRCIELFKLWPDYSGIESYPVPSPHHCSALDAYHRASKEGDLYAGEYGMHRANLAAFLKLGLVRDKSRLLLALYEPDDLFKVMEDLRKIEQKEGEGSAAGKIVDILDDLLQEILA